MTSRRKMVRALAGVVLVLGAAAAVWHGRTGQVEGARKPSPVSEVHFSDREETLCHPGKQEFMLEDLQGLSVCVVWSGLAGTYAAQLTFVSPDGHVYQTMTLAFVTPDAPVTAATVEVQGREHEVKRAGWRRKGETVLVATLPVAGTYITQHNLAGYWKVEISLNGQPVDSDHFVLHTRQ